MTDNNIIHIDATPHACELSCDSEIIAYHDAVEGWTLVVDGEDVPIKKLRKALADMHHMLGMVSGRPDRD